MKKILTFCLILFLGISLSPAEAQDNYVMLNTKTYIYHNPGCRWAKKCTKTAFAQPDKKPKNKAPGPARFAADKHLNHSEYKSPGLIIFRYSLKITNQFFLFLSFCIFI